MKLAYLLSQDEVIVEVSPLPDQPSLIKGPFKIWSDKKHLICGLAIRDFQRMIEEFHSTRGIIKLGGLWRNLSITDTDIKRARQELLAKLKEQW